MCSLTSLPIRLVPSRIGRALCIVPNLARTLRAVASEQLGHLSVLILQRYVGQGDNPRLSSDCLFAAIPRRALQVEAGLRIGCATSVLLSCVCIVPQYQGIAGRSSEKITRLAIMLVQVVAVCRPLHQELRVTKSPEHAGNTATADNDG